MIFLSVDQSHRPASRTDVRGFAFAAGLVPALLHRAGGFGLLSASFGIGAIIGALYIPPQLHRVPLNAVVSAGIVLWALATLLIAATHTIAIALAGACAAGAAWVTVLASLSAGTQSTAPAWVRARAVAMSLVAMQTSLALGSVLWGWLANSEGTRIALGVSAGTMFALLALSDRVRVRMGDEADVTPGLQRERKRCCPTNSLALCVSLDGRFAPLANHIPWHGRLTALCFLATCLGYL